MTQDAGPIGAFDSRSDDARRGDGRSTTFTLGALVLPANPLLHSVRTRWIKRTLSSWRYQQGKNGFGHPYRDLVRLCQAAPLALKPTMLGIGRRHPMTHEGGPRGGRRTPLGTPMDQSA